MKKLLPKTSGNSQGFTLIELLVVIAILAILATIGITIFSNTQKEARDAKRKGDINALAQAYEVKAAGGAYQPISNNDFGSDIKPTDPNKGEYFNWFASDGSGFKVCASLDDNPNIACNTPAQNCFCKMSVQGTPNPSSAADPSSTQASLGLGGASASACAPNGLFVGLTAYWKMDEASGNRADSSGYGNTLTDNNTVTSNPGKFGNAGQFTRANSEYLSMASNSNVAFGDTNFTISTWVYLDSKPYHMILVGKVAPGIADYQLIYNTVSDRWFFEVYGPVFDEEELSWGTGTIGAVNANNAGSPSIGTWYHIVAWHDTDTNQVGIQVNNGTPNTATLTGTAGAATNVELNLGRRLANELHLDGRLDEVRLYKCLLSPQERTNLYNFAP